MLLDDLNHDHHFTAGSSLDLLKMWHNTYLAVISMLALKAHLHSQPLPNVELAKFNVMHTTFITAYIHPTCSQTALLRASQVFTALLSRHFKRNLQVDDTRTHARTHACTHARMHMHTYTPVCVCV